VVATGAGLADVGRRRAAGAGHRALHRRASPPSAPALAAVVRPGTAGGAHCSGRTGRHRWPVASRCAPGQPGSEALHDQAWWQRIDPKDDLAEPQRRLLAEGAYRPQVAADDVAEVRRWARERYLQLLQERRR